MANCNVLARWFACLISSQAGTMPDKWRCSPTYMTQLTCLLSCYTFANSEERIVHDENNIETTIGGCFRVGKIPHKKTEI